MQIHVLKKLEFTCINEDLTHYLSFGVCCTMRDFSSRYFSMLALQ